VFNNHEIIGQEICKDFQRLSSNRGNFESHWQEIAERIYPSHSTMFQSRGQATQGEKRNNQVYDSTAALALKRFAAILDSLLTPRNQTWHRLHVDNKELARDRDVQMYFEETTRLLFKYRYAAQANFSSQNQQNYLSLGAYGTGSMFTDALINARGGGLRYRAVHLSEIYFKENHQGIVDTAIRKFKMTARQLAQKYQDKIPEKVREALKVNPDKEFEVLHCVKPNDQMDPTRKDHRGMAFSSYYVLCDGAQVLQVGGYNSFPYAVPRYEQSPNEIYGRSPAMDVLPAIKTLNEQKKTMLKQGHRAADPVLLAHDDGVLDGVSLKPGAVNYGGVSADGRLLVQTLPTGNFQIGKDMMDQERQVINDAFLVNLFQILTESPQMTATEVVERAREKGILIAPTVGRQETEYLGPMIEREIDVLSQQGLLPQMPDVLREAKGEYQIVHDSPLSRAQRMEEAAGVMRTIEHALTIVNATQNPEPLDFFDWDTIVPELSTINGAPARFMRSVENVAQIRQRRAEQLQIEQSIQAGPAEAAMMKAEAVANKGK
jgi:hypothetical protein